MVRKRGFFAAFFPLLVGVVFNFIFLPESKNQFNGNNFYIYLTQISSKNFSNRMNEPYMILFPEWFLNSPKTYTIMYVLAIAIFFDILSAFTYTISFKIKKQAYFPLFLPRSYFLSVLCKKINLKTAADISV